MSTTAWRFRSTEGADDAVLKLKQLQAQDLIDLQDVAVVRWPQHAHGPATQEHVTDEGNMISGLVSKLRGAGRIDSGMLDSVKTTMVPGTSAVVMMSYGAVVDVVAKAFEGETMELIRSDLPVQEQDQLRREFGDPSQPGSPNA
jgi:uncharacterized membrane protein